MPAAALTFADVRKTYQSRHGHFEALRGVSLELAEGEFFGLLGPNGAGKTTLISILAGLVRPSGGSVRVRGHDVQGDPVAARRLLGVVPQELVFDPFFTVRETLSLQSSHFGVHGNGAWIDELLHSLGLTDKADANMRQLSGGMKRRVLVAQALVHKPPIIVLDEPTAGVDVELRQTLWHFITRLNRQGHTVLLTTHYLEEAQALCQRIAMLKGGQLAALDDTSSLLRRVAPAVLQFKTAQPLPASIAAHARVTGSVVQIPLTPALTAALDTTGAHTAPASDNTCASQTAPDTDADAARHVQVLLGVLHAAGVPVQDMEIRRADLEDVFVHIMQGTAAKK